MTTFSFMISCPEGLNAPKADELIKELTDYTSYVTLTKDGRKANPHIIFNLLGLSARQGDVLEVSLKGEEESVEAERLKEFVSKNL